jgi:hypothetical protein
MLFIAPTKKSAVSPFINTALISEGAIKSSDRFTGCQSAGMGNAC